MSNIISLSLGFSCIVFTRVREKWCTQELCAPSVWWKDEQHSDVQRVQNCVSGHRDVSGSFSSCSWWGELHIAALSLMWIFWGSDLIWVFPPGLQEEESEESHPVSQQRQWWWRQGKHNISDQWEWRHAYRNRKQVPAEESKETGQETSQGEDTHTLVQMVNKVGIVMFLEFVLSIMWILCNYVKYIL